MFWSILTGFRTGFLGSDGSNPEPNLNRTQKQVRGSAFCPNRTQVQVRGSEKRVSEPNRTELSQHYSAISVSPRKKYTMSYSIDWCVPLVAERGLYITHRRLLPS